MDDPEVLAMAASTGRILVSSDFATMPIHFGEFMVRHGKPPDVLLVSQKAPIGEIIEEILIVWAASQSDDWAGRMLEIPL